MAHKFLNLIENTIHKMTNGGMLVGQYVTGLVSNYKSRESFKSLPDSMQTYIEDMFAITDLNKKIIDIKTEMPSNLSGNTDNRGTVFHAVVAVELTNGLNDIKNAVTIPGDLLEISEDEVNFGSNVPDSVKYDNKVQIKPEEPEENEEQQQTMTQQGDDLKKSDLTLPESYTARYMPING